MLSVYNVQLHQFYVFLWYQCFAAYFYLVMMTGRLFVQHQSFRIWCMNSNAVLQQHHEFINLWICCQVLQYEHTMCQSFTFGLMLNSTLSSICWFVTLADTTLLLVPICALKLLDLKKLSLSYSTTPIPKLWFSAERKKVRCMQCFSTLSWRKDQEQH